MRRSWRHVRIGDWGAVTGGRQKSPHASGTERPYLRVANVFEDRIDTTDLNTMPFAPGEFERFRLLPGDILLNEGQSEDLVGRSAIYMGEPPVCAFQNTLVRFRPGSDCDPRYAQQVFKYLWKTGVFRGIAKKTTSIAHLGVNRFANLAVVVPAIEEQRLIVRPLELLERVDQTQRELIAALRNRKQAFARSLLMESAELKSWAQFDTLCEELRIRNSGRLGSDDVMGVVKGVGFQPMRARVRGRGDLSRYLIVPTGAFAYNPMRINIGSIAFNGSGRDVLVSPDYVVFRPRAGVASATYVDQLRYSSIWQRFMRRAGSGSVRVRIYFDDLGKLRVPRPVLREQERIAAALTLMDQEISLLETQREKYQVYKRGLMSRLLSGELTVPS